MSNSTSRESVNSLSDIEWYRNFENLHNNIYYRLVNAEVYKSIPRDIIREPFLNMGKLYYVYDKTRDLFKDGYINICKHHLSMWKITEEEFKAVAKENVKRQPIEAIRLEGSLADKISKIKAHIGFFEYNEKYIVRTKDLEYGAAAFCNIKQFAVEQQSDLIILAYSVKELLVVIDKDHDNYDINMLRGYKEILDTLNIFTMRENILSYSLYVYDLATDKFENVRC